MEQSTLSQLTITFKKNLKLCESELAESEISWRTRKTSERRTKALTTIVDDAGIDWATDTDPFFVFLGIYVACFQWIEGKLGEILLLEASFENREEIQARFVRTRNEARVDAAAQAAINAERFLPIKASQNWEDRVQGIRERLHAERQRRNAILHSQYWLRGLEHGLDAIRTDLRKREGSLIFEHEDMNRARMDQILREMAVLSFDVGQIHLQLVHWA